VCSLARGERGVEEVRPPTFARTAPLPEAPASPARRRPARGRWSRTPGTWHACRPPPSRPRWGRGGRTPSSSVSLGPPPRSFPDVRRALVRHTLGRRRRKGMARKVHFRSSSANFSEPPQGEVRRMRLPRTRVNKGGKKAGLLYPVLSCLAAQVSERLLPYQMRTRRQL
jgi:hypothetical protein